MCKNEGIVFDDAFSCADTDYYDIFKGTGFDTGTSKGEAGTDPSEIFPAV